MLEKHLLKAGKTPSLPTGSFAGDRGASSNHPGRACDERPVGEDLMEEGADQRKHHRPIKNRFLMVLDIQ